MKSSAAPSSFILQRLYNNADLSVFAPEPDEAVEACLFHFELEAVEFYDILGCGVFQICSDFLTYCVWGSGALEYHPSSHLVVCHAEFISAAVVGDLVGFRDI